MAWPHWNWQGKIGIGKISFRGIGIGSIVIANISYIPLAVLASTVLEHCMNGIL